MNIRVLSASYLGVESFLIETEIDISNGLPMFSIIGLGDTAINESKDRIRTALKNSDFKLEPKKIIVNLSPAGIKKEGAHFDLPIAIGIICAMGFIKDRHDILNNYLVLGELSLNGDIKRVNGVINAVIYAKENNFKGVIIPKDNYYEATLISGVDVIPVSNLQDVVDFLLSNKVNLTMPTIDFETNNNIIDIDFSDVKGQNFAKRALEIAAAGKHNLLLIGSPGCGKTMLCKRITTILPPMTTEEIIEATKIYSIAGELNRDRPIIDSIPFRSPHHTSSPVSIIGGGKKIKPGEITLANGGILFFDEIGEFHKSVLESLRQPLEDRAISISRAQYKVSFKTNFLFLATSNPCQCGFLYEGNQCTCTQTEVNRYLKKFSGPIMDRIDLHVQMKKLSPEELINAPKGESSEIIRKRVILAREIQRKRFNGNFCNGEMNSKQIKKYCILSEETIIYLKNALKVLGISGRGYDKILKVARTIADLENCVNIEKKHLMEAISFRK